MEENIAIITARSGSKGLKDKNIKSLGGKPLMAYSIEAAIRSGMFSVIHVSTDSVQYAEIARTYGAEVPFLREKELASDSAGSWDVVQNVLAHYEADGKTFKNVMLLQPTSPLRTAGDIRNAFALQCEKQAAVVLSVCEMEHSPLWSNTLPPDGRMTGFMDKAKNVQRQQLPVYYRLNGAIYLVDVEYLERGGDLFGDRTYAYVMPKERSVDIDDAFDFSLVQTYLQSDGSMA